MFKVEGSKGTHKKVLPRKLVDKKISFYEHEAITVHKE